MVSGVFAAASSFALSSLCRSLSAAQWVLLDFSRLITVQPEWYLHNLYSFFIMSSSTVSQTEWKFVLERVVKNLSASWIDVFWQTLQWVRINQCHIYGKENKVSIHEGLNWIRTVCFLQTLMTKENFQLWSDLHETHDKMRWISHQNPWSSTFLTTKHHGLIHYLHWQHG